MSCSEFKTQNFSSLCILDGSDVTVVLCNSSVFSVSIPPSTHFHPPAFCFFFFFFFFLLAFVLSPFDVNYFKTIVFREYLHLHVY